MQVSSYVLLLLFYIATTTSCGLEPKNADNSPTPTLALNNNQIVTKSFANGLVSMRWLVGPSVGVIKDDEVEFSFSDHQGNPLKVSSFNCWPYMSIHGHGAGGNTIITKINPHRFVASNFIFTMSGPWEMELRFMVESRSYELSFNILLAGE